MYIRNIITAMGELNDDEVLLINFRSGRQCTVKKTDKMVNKNGELIVTRIIPSTFKDERRCVIYIDSAEVESMIIQRSEDL